MKFLKSVLPLVCAMFVVSAAAAKDITIGLVLDRGGKDDKSFNAAAFAGSERCKKELKSKVKVIEAPDDNAFEQLHTRFAQDGKYDLIIGVGFAQKEAMEKVAKKFPKTNFALVDDVAKVDNVKSLVFQEHEGSFLVGAIAALTSKTGKIGFVGGQDVPIIHRFALAYSAGAKHVKPNIQITENYVGVTPDAWKDPGKGKELALAQYSSGVDIIFAAAGASGFGVFDAAEQNKKFVIGVDSNQNYMKPGFVLTSMLKKVDEAVFQACKEVSTGSFKGGIVTNGLASGGIDYAMDKYNKNLISADVIKKVEAIRNEIKQGKIQVPDYYKINEKK